MDYTCGVQKYCHPHFTDVKTKAQNVLRDLPKVTQLVNGGAVFKPKHSDTRALSTITHFCAFILGLTSPQTDPRSCPIGTITLASPEFHRLIEFWVQ